MRRPFDPFFVGTTSHHRCAGGRRRLLANSLREPRERAKCHTLDHLFARNLCATRIDVATFTETDINTYLAEDWTDENDRNYFEHVHANYTAGGLEHLSGSDYCSDEQDFQVGEEN